MSKKIYDILPPKLANKKKNAIKKADESKNDFIDPIIRSKKQKSESVAHPFIEKKRVPLREILVGGAVILLLFSIFLYNKLPRADIQIWPIMTQFYLQEKIAADVSVNATDVSRKVFPAQYIEQNQEGWQEFLATEEVSTDKKATGTIKIYNKLDSLTVLTLIKGTHFLSDSGKYFVISEKVIIPAAQYQKGKLVAGSISVRAEAEQAGEDYNVGPSKFSIPKLSGSPYYYSIYAESIATMTGGHKGSSKRVTQDDLDKAKAFLTKKLLDQAETVLRGKLSPEDMVIDNSLVKSVVDFTTTAKKDTLIEKFDAQSTVKVSVLIFKRSELEQFARNIISLGLSKEDTFLEKSLDISYSPISVDSKKGLAQIDLKLSALTYKNIHANALVELFTQKSSDEIKNLMGENYGDSVSKVEVNFWPFWVKSAPSNKNRINVELKF